MSLRIQVRHNDTVAVDEIGGGGYNVEVEALNVTENGVYSEDGVAYSPVSVNVEAGYVNSALDGYNLTRNIVYNDAMVIMQQLGASQSQISDFIYLWDKARLACEELD